MECLHSSFSEPLEAASFALAMLCPAGAWDPLSTVALTRIAAEVRTVWVCVFICWLHSTWGLQLGSRHEGTECYAGRVEE